MAKIISSGKPVGTGPEINIDGASYGVSEFPGAGGVKYKYKDPLEKKEKELNIKAKEKALEGGILSQVDKLGDIVLTASEALEKRGFIGPVGGRASGFLAKELGGGKVMQPQDVVLRQIAGDYGKQLQYAAAAGIAKQEGRALSDADLRIAGAIAPELDKEIIDVIRTKTNLLIGLAKGTLKKDDIPKILGVEKYENKTKKDNPNLNKPKKIVVGGIEIEIMGE